MLPWLILSLFSSEVKCVCRETVLHQALMFLCILQPEVLTAFVLGCLFRDVCIALEGTCPWKNNVGSTSSGVLRCSGVHPGSPLCNVLRELLLRGIGTVANALDLSKTLICHGPRSFRSPASICETGGLRCELALVRRLKSLPLSSTASSTTCYLVFLSTTCLCLGSGCDLFSLVLLWYSLPPPAFLSLHAPAGWFP